MPRQSPDPAVDERLILTGLACEWELAVSELDPLYRGRLKRPLFRLMGTTDRLGQWDGTKRQISISRRLAQGHPWDEVRDVLLHETAHQLAELFPTAKDQPPHGPAFRQACLMLRADPSASASRNPLHERLATGCGMDDHPLRVRIRKLFSLAQSNHRHEAEAAMRKAHELMARHHLTIMKADPERTFISVFLGAPALRHFKESYFLANLIQDFYFVQGIWVPAFVVSKERMGHVLEISGTPANVSQAGYVFDFVQAYIDRQWQKLTSEKRLTRYQKSDFAVGVIEGLRRKLEQEQYPDCRPQEQALIRRPDPQLCTYLRQRYPRTNHIRRGGGRQDQETYQKGVAAGETLVLHRGITDRSQDTTTRRLTQDTSNR